MTTNIVDHADAKTVGAACGARVKLTWPTFVLVGIFVALGAAGCEGYHSAHQGQDPGSVTISGGDRPYFYPLGIRKSF